jgi:hypothetical protein
VEKLIKVGLEDLAKAFDIKVNLYKLYREEILTNKNLLFMMESRGKIENWQKVTPLGGPGTVLNGICLYCLTRCQGVTNIVETGVSGGFYTGFLLEAINRNNRPGSLLTSIELADNNQIGKLIPNELDKKFWHLITGKDSVTHLQKVNYGVSCQLFCHDSLHTMKHMSLELMEFKKQMRQPSGLMFFDDQDSDLFWVRSLQTKAFQKPGYKVRHISGNESRLNGHLGGFLLYEKI